MRKIVICGKGGSGKSTVIALLAHTLRERGYRVLVLDADESNPGLHRLLGLPARPQPLMDLLGGKKSVMKSFNGEQMPENTVLLQERIRVDDLPEAYRATADGITLVASGKILQSMEGCACPIGFLSRQFLRRLALDEDEIALVDTEAGIEHFGRGVEEGADAVIAIVDPSYDALELAAQVHQMALQSHLPGAWALLNKVTSEKTAHALTYALKERGLRILGAVRYDPAVAEAGLEGNALLGATAAQGDVAAILTRLIEG